MIAVALVAMLQFGSCQSGGPDTSRTTAEVASTFFEGLTARKPEAIRWVTRRGTVWRSGDTVTSDTEVYAQLETDEWPIRRIVVTGLIVNGATAAATTVVRGDPSSETMTVLSIAEGCVTEVRVF